MGKGSKQRPTKAEFWRNWDAVFGEKSEDHGLTNYHCGTCGWVEEHSVWFENEVNHESMGDQTVERILVTLSCEVCGGDIDEFFNV